MSPERTQSDGDGATLHLPNVTLCAVTSVALEETVEALERSMRAIRFASVKLISDRQAESMPPGIEHVQIRNLASRQDYSHFVLKELALHIKSEYVLVIQWDGFILNPSSWDEAFLTCDYIGAVWPQFSDGHNVGNGGFSLRSLRLLRACADPRITGEMAEDEVIGRRYRALLEHEFAIRFADEATANRFAYERGIARGDEFGFHGVFNMGDVLGFDRLAEVLEGLPFDLIGQRERRNLLQIALMRRNVPLLRALLAPFWHNPWRLVTCGGAIFKLGPDLLRSAWGGLKTWRLDRRAFRD